MICEGIGAVYAIPSGQHYFYGVGCRGGDMLFLDVVSDLILDSEKLRAARELFRVPIDTGSLRHARAQKVGEALGFFPNAATPVDYINKPVGSKVAYVVNGQTGARTIATSVQEATLETLAVWDLKEHLVPVLRQHFFGEITPHSKMLKAKIGR